MSNVKVSQLKTTDDISNVQAVGVKDGAVLRYNIGNVDQKISTVLNGIMSPSSQDEFGTDKTYYAGQFCYYDGKLYRFVRTHYAGSWYGDLDNSDVVETTLVKELNAMASTDYETLKVEVSFVDATNTKTSDSISERYVTISFDDGNSQSLKTDEDGIATFTIPKGVHYVLSAPPIDGFATPVPTDYTAAISSSKDGTDTYGGRVVHVIYRPGTLDTCDITVHICIDNYSDSINGQYYDGLQAYLRFPHGEEEARATLNPIVSTIEYDDTQTDIRNTTTVKFEGVKQGSYCMVFLPYVEGFIEQNNTEGFFVSGNTMDIYINILYSEDFGIRYVCGETETSIADETRWREYTFDDFKNLDGGTYDASKHPMVAVHLNPGYLATKKLDYYVKPESLTKTSGYVSGGLQWCTANNLFAHIYTNTSGIDSTKQTLSQSESSSSFACNGKLMTTYMIYDAARQYSLTSPAALWAVKQTMTKNGITSTGFIGTRAQMNALFNKVSKAELDSAYQYFFSTTTTYYSGTYFWSSTQYNATNAWSWYSGSDWYTYSKTRTNVVLPFFAF